MVARRVNWKRWLFLLLTLGVIGVMAYFIAIDINRDPDYWNRTPDDQSALMMENLEFEREVSGDIWRVRTPIAERRLDIVEFHIVYVERRLASGKEWLFRGAHGLYSEAIASADVTDVVGTIETADRVLNLESPFLVWTMNENTFLFPKGVTVYDEEISLKADLASIDEYGIIALNEGAVIRWKKITDTEDSYSEDSYSNVDSD